MNDARNPYARQLDLTDSALDNDYRALCLAVLSVSWEVRQLREALISRIDSDSAPDDVTFTPSEAFD